MEDLRDAEKTVSEFATLIDNLRPPDNTSHLGGDFSDLLTQRQNSTGSHKSGKGSIGSRWRPKTLKKDWGETTEGILWNELEQSQNQVAQQFKLDQTTLKEYISSPAMMDLGHEFVRHYHGDLVEEKAYWAAEDLFFDLQAVKQGDTDAGRWAEAKVYKKDWDLADHLVRFVLLAEQCRLCSGQEKWIAWQWSFAGKVGFYLSVLRCYTIRDAKQKELAKSSASSPSSSHISREGSKHEQSSQTHDVGKKGSRAEAVTKAGE